MCLFLRKGNPISIGYYAVAECLPSIAEAGPVMPVWDSVPQIYTILVYVHTYVCMYTWKSLAVSCRGRHGSCWGLPFN